jgi:hypothetical protein
MFKHIGILVFFVIGGVSTAWGQSCTETSQLKDKIDAIQVSYAGDVKAMENRVKSEAETIQKDAPNPDNPVEAAISFDLDVSSHDEEFIFHVPEVTMKDQKISLDLPQVTMRQQKWIFDLPATKMELQCINGIPETVCKMVTKSVGFGIKIDVPECYTRAGQDICTEVPVFLMEKHEVVLGIPEFIVDRTEFSMGIPEVTMKEQKIVLTIPDFTVKNVKVEAKETKEKAEELSTSAKKDAAELSYKLKSEIEQTSLQGIRDTFDCQRRGLEAQRVSSLSKLDANLEVFKVSLQKAREVGAAEIAAQMEKSLTDLGVARANADLKFQEALGGLNSEMDKAIKAAVGKGFTTVSAAQ